MNSILIIFLRKQDFLSYVMNMYLDLGMLRYLCWRTRKEMIEILEIWEMGFVIKAEFIIITPVFSVT